MAKNDFNELMSIGVDRNRSSMESSALAHIRVSLRKQKIRIFCGLKKACIRRFECVTFKGDGSMSLTKFMGSAAALSLWAGTALAAPISIIPEPATTLVPGEVVDAVYLEQLDAGGNVEVVGYAFIDDNGDLFRHEFVSGDTSFVSSGISEFRSSDGRIVAVNLGSSTGTEVYEFDGTLVSTPAELTVLGSNHRGDLVGVVGGGGSAYLENGSTSVELFPAGGSNVFGGFQDIDNLGNAFGQNVAQELYSVNVFSGLTSGGPNSSFGSFVNGDGLFAFANDGTIWATDGSLTGSFGAGVFGQGHVAGEGFYAISGRDALFFDMGLSLVGQATLAGDIFDIRYDEGTNDYFALFEGSLRETGFEFDFSASNVAAVPLPATVWMLGLAIGGLFEFRKRQVA